MQVRDIMSPHTVCVTPQATLDRVAQLMVDNDCGAIPVVEDLDARHPVGIITDRDITCRTVARGVNPLTVKAFEVMSTPTVVIAAQGSIEECVALMERHQVRRMLVVDDEGTLCGMVAQADIAQVGPPEEAAELLQDVSLPLFAPHGAHRHTQAGRETGKTLSTR